MLKQMILEPGTIIAAAWVAAAIVWLIGSMTTKATVRSQTVASRLLEIAPLILGLVLLRTDRSLFRLLSVRFVPATAGWEMIGAAVTVAGVGVAIWSRFLEERARRPWSQAVRPMDETDTLSGGPHPGPLRSAKNGSATITVKRDHELIRSGPYSVVRHPIYSGFLLAILGTAIYGGELKGLLALVLASITWKIKSLHEETFMAGEFGEEYTHYRREVKALVPFVW